MTRRRHVILGLAGSALLPSVFMAGCASTIGMRGPAFTPPVIFVHGNGDNSGLWQTTIWRFESNGWPADRLFAGDMPFPLARDEDQKAQSGRSSTREQRDFLAAEVKRVLLETGADKCVLIGNSRGGYAIRDYIANGAGRETVSHVILGGTPNHGVWSLPGYKEGSEFSGTGPFLTALNKPEHPGDPEATPGIRWLTIRSDNNDKYAQTTGEFIGLAGKPTGITTEGPALTGATNVVLPRVDHRETAFSPMAFDAMWRFLTGSAPATTAVIAEVHPVLQGMVTGRGASSIDATSGNFVNNQPLEGAKLEIWQTDPATGARMGREAFSTLIGRDGHWGPFTANSAATYEFVVSAPGYTTTHVYRSALPRSTRHLNFRPERLAPALRSEGGAVVLLSRPRGYFDRQRDSIMFDGSAVVPGVPPTGAGVSLSTLRLADARTRTVVGRFNDEQIAGQTWPVADGNVTLLELTY